MDVFELHRRIIESYTAFTRGFNQFSGQEIGIGCPFRAYSNARWLANGQQHEFPR